MLKNVLKQNNNIFDIFNMSVTCNYFPYLEIKLFNFCFFFLNTFYRCFQQ